MNLSEHKRKPGSPGKVNRYPLYASLLTILFVFSSCSDSTQTVKTAYFQVENPRQLGKERFLTVVDGKVTGWESSPSPRTTTIREYVCEVAIYWRGRDGKLAPTQYYDANKRGFSESIDFDIHPHKANAEISFGSYVAIGIPADAENCFCVIYGITEQTGERVLSIPLKELLVAGRSVSVSVPDLMTLPALNLEAYRELQEAHHNSTSTK